ncbi:MAG: hypothetical protein MJ232_08360 [archaeon]|nr:hypothetical protein [archaeon]
MKMKKSLLFLSLLIILCVSLGAVSAADMSINDMDSVDNTQSMGINQDDSNQKNVELIKLQENPTPLSELEEEINNAKSGATIKLTKDYEVDSSEYEMINIDKPLTIDGQGHTIDGSNYNGIFCLKDNITLKNINFINTKTSHNAGAVYCVAANCSVVNCSFVNCSAYYGGGAVYCVAANCSVVNCSFVNCTAKIGGAVYCDGANCSVLSCSFIDCFADDGGAIRWVYPNYGVVSGCSFVNCSSNNNGGAISLWNYNSSVINCSFIDCFSKICGGAIYCTGDNCSVVNCSFVNCIANMGGAINLGNYNSSVLSCSFVNCAADDGGAIFCYDSIGSVLSCSFVNCAANVGGAVYCDDVDFVVNYNIFDNNLASTGSAIYTQSSIDCDFNFFAFENNITIFPKGLVSGTAVNKWVVLNISKDNSRYSVDFVCNDGSTLTKSMYDYAANLNINGDVKEIVIKNNTFKDEGIIGDYLLNSRNSGNVLARITLKGDTLTKFIDATKGTVYNGEYYSVCLVDNSGNALASKTVTINIAGKTYNVTTDKNGLAKVKLAITSKYLNKSLTVTYKFIGDNDFKASSGSSNIKVIKTPTKITNATKLVVKNHKNIYVKLTTKSGKVLANKVITMKSRVSGKIYKIKTNSKGIAKTDLWVKNKSLGKYYKYTFKYVGNTYYNSCTKTFKIKIIK